MAIIKKSKQVLYLKGYSRILDFRKLDFRKKIAALSTRVSDEQLQQVLERVNYYCKTSFISNPQSVQIRDLKKPKNPKAYYFDTFEYARYFDESIPINFVFGDVIEVPEYPAIVKSRPITEDNQNSVLLNLDKVRHFVWVKDQHAFETKRNILIGRGAVFQHHRHEFYEKYFHHPLCDLGQVNSYGGNMEWYKPKMSLARHLENKFILSLEGNDVATNLKWIMSSNSIAVMPKPKYETWFMEAKLEGGKHFIEIKEDYSDVEEQLKFYASHPEKCLEIIKNANEFCAQFFNPSVEDLCGLMVLEKYLKPNL